MGRKNHRELPQTATKQGRVRLERRPQVFQAALDVIADKGLEETRISDIAAAAGMSAGHIMYYFTSKSDMLMQTLKWSDDQFINGAKEAMKSLPTAQERLSCLVGLSIPESSTDPAWILWLETWARAPHDRKVASVKRRLEKTWITTLADVIKEGQAAGEFVELDAEYFATLFSALIDGLVIRMMGGSGGMTKERLLAICAQQIDAGLILGRTTLQLGLN
ncbi:MAG TPA: TetR/AcrR family transcriptional regulator [Acidimicrobiales bacterium]|nr:TetR/AcrR family transcriptional regulator [Acidimicrobiales bacterium]